MYRQILVHPADRDLQRILWRNVSSDKINEYQLNTITYGLACAPFLAIRTLRQLANDEESRFPLGACTLREDVYMDDILSGADSTNQAKKLQQQLSQLCLAGGFPLKKWAANDDKILDGIPSTDRVFSDARSWTSHDSHSTLGLHWRPNTDDFVFSLTPLESGNITKRSVLSQAARLFDPLGWLAPVIVRAKIFIQSTWLQGLDWDDPLNDNDVSSWKTFLEDLTNIARIRVPRWLNSTSQIKMELHGFADASERAYAAVIYLRSKELSSDFWKTNIILAKTRVSPLKQVSLPRLELCAAILLTRLMVYVQTTLHLSTTPIHMWSDSTVTLGWIRGHPSRWKTYVANRVSEIQTALPNALWHHVSGQDNPADCASRGLSATELLDYLLWWQGPSWLTDSTTVWKCQTKLSEEEELPEQRKTVHVETTQFQLEEPALVNEILLSLSRLLRITAWCRRWLRRPLSNKKTSISVEELGNGLEAWIRVVQIANFKIEIEKLSINKSLKNNDQLIRLNPFIDDRGIMRVGGRIQHSLLSNDEKHPIILPSISNLTVLIIRSCHLRMLHGGVQQTLGLIRQRYWIPRGRTIVKSLINRCLLCIRWRAATPHQIMADLPSPRVTPSRPFLHTGIDYAGPIMLRINKGRGCKTSKAFIAVFICFSTKAVHLEVVSDYSSEAFIAALRRFTSRRGLCKVIYSDCGTNFVGADRELRNLFSASSQESQRIVTFLSKDQMQWRFNPPSAPHFGGLWEAAVKSTKYHLKRVIGEVKLTFEEMTTLLTQVEACLNSRPLQPLSDDPEDLEALTPGHFLIGSSLLAVPDPSLADVSVNQLSRWQLLQQMREHFWRRWSQEYLHSLSERPK